MRTTIRAWGNSVGVRIPKIFAMQLGIVPGKEVDIVLDANCLRIAPLEKDLESLLEKITPENMHAEIPTGSPLGKEVW